MKASRLVTLVACVLYFSRVATSQEKDDIVIVVKEIALGSGKGRKTLTRGVEVRVLDVKGDKLLVADRVDGWVSKSHVATSSKALDVFTDQIKRNPKDADAYIARAMMLRRQNHFDSAIDDYTRALRLNPKLPEVFLNRGNCWSIKKEYDKAIADYTEALRLVPTSDTVYTMRGNSWEKQREYKKAESDWIEAIRLNPKSDYAYNQLAWLKATCHDAGVRDGKKAVEYATKLCQLSDWKSRGDLDTLAASYAEAGDFENAVKWQSEVCKLAPENEKADCQARLELYKSGKPFHEILTE